MLDTARGERQGGQSDAASPAPVFLLRYDTENTDAALMSGFLEKVVAVHRAEKIPVTLFCTGGALDAREEEFRAFCQEVKDDPLFDLQDHSYSHIGLGYDRGKPVAVLRADYARSFAAHERVFGKRPVGISVCGTSGADGDRVTFDATEKSRAEFAMVVELGARMINANLAGRAEDRQFCSYAAMGFPEVMGFPSAFSDTRWMVRREAGDRALDDPVGYILGIIEERGRAGQHMPLMLHDWVAWTRSPDKELSHVKRFADKARELGFGLRTHAQCLEDKALWA